MENTEKKRKLHNLSSKKTAINSLMYILPTRFSTCISTHTFLYEAFFHFTFYFTISLCLLVVSKNMIFNSYTAFHPVVVPPFILKLPYFGR